MVHKVKKPGFEEALGQLEEITRQLERGSLSLEDSVRAYEKGVELSDHCQKMLKQAERKLETIVQREDGQLEKQPIDPQKVETEGLDQSRLF